MRSNSEKALTETNGRAAGRLAAIDTRVLGRLIEVSDCLAVDRRLDTAREHRGATQQQPQRATPDVELTVSHGFVSDHRPPPLSAFDAV